MKLGIFLIACVALAVQAKTEKKNINIVCKALPTKRHPVEWPKQPKDTILDFKKLEELKANLEKKPKPTILSLDDLKAKFSSKLAAEFKEFSQADMKARKTMKMFKKKKMGMM